MNKLWVRNRMKKFYGRIWGSAIREGGACKNPVRLAM